MTREEGKVYRGFTYDNREYIVYFNDTYPSTVVINFPGAERPVRVDYSQRCGSSNCNGGWTSRGTLTISAEYHYDYDKGWDLFAVNDKLLLADKGYGDIVFLEETDGFQWIKTNYEDLPDDIYGQPVFVEFDDMCLVKLHKKYHRDNSSYKAKIVFWYRNNNQFEYPEIIKDATYRDGGTYKATLKCGDREYDLVIPNRIGTENKIATLNELEGKVWRHNSGSNYDVLWGEFRKASGLKLYYTAKVIDDCPEPEKVE